jgi:hypothetical protein
VILKAGLGRMSKKAKATPKPSTKGKSKPEAALLERSRLATRAVEVSLDNADTVIEGGPRLRSQSIDRLTFASSKPRVPHVSRCEAVTKLPAECARWNKQGVSRAAAACDSPARQCRERVGGTKRVRFSGRHEFRNSLAFREGGLSRIRIDSSVGQCGATVWTIAEDEVSAVRNPTFRKPRNVGHPRFGWRRR